jgi:hypothetical protein
MHFGKYCELYLHDQQVKMAKSKSLFKLYEIKIQMHLQYLIVLK